MAYAPQGGNYEQIGGPGYSDAVQQQLQFQPVQQQPGYTSPTYTQPTQPVFIQPTQPVYTQPVYTQPVYTHNAYTQPVYIQPNPVIVGASQPSIKNEITIVNNNQQQSGGFQHFGRYGCKFHCKNCNTERLSNTEREFIAWVAFILLVIFFFPLAWVPFVMDSCYRIKHTCPGCGMVVGFYQSS